MFSIHKRSNIFYLITGLFGVYFIATVLNRQHLDIAKSKSSKLLAIITSKSIKQSDNEYDYSNPYSKYINTCRSNNTKTNPNLIKYSPIIQFNNTDSPLRTKQIIRAVLFYFPTDKVANFEPEFKWMYQSWLESLKYQSVSWRTDLVIFINEFNQTEFNLFERLNCSFGNNRQHNKDASMCTLIKYVPIKDRHNSESRTYSYDYYLKRFNIFNTSKTELSAFYNKLRNDLDHYSYTDSILMAFDGYEYLRTRYDYVIRSDLDVFLTRFRFMDTTVL